MRTKITPVSSGFTLVELVMVIILIGVLSVLGIGLFTRSSAFSPLLATQQLQSATLLAQQAALAGNPYNFFVNINQDAGPDSDSLVLTVGTPDTPESSTFAIDQYGASITYRTSSSAAFMALPPSGYTIKFNSKGWVESPAQRQITEFLISGESVATEFFLCLSSLGAVYRAFSEGQCYD